MIHGSRPACDEKPVQSIVSVLKMHVLAITNIYPSAKAPDSGVFVEQQVKGLRAAGVDIDVLIVNRRERGRSCYLTLFNEVQSKVREVRPDIVHSMYGGVMADIVTRAVNDRSTVVTFHGSDLLGDRSAGRIMQLMANYGVRASWRAARRATGIVAVSEIVGSALPDNIDRSKVRIIPCGIDLERFRPLDRAACRRQLGWTSNKFYVLFGGNGGNPIKRFHLAQAAVHELSALGVAAEIRQLQGLENRIVPLWINASDVVLLTSFHEGSPTIVKEALACGVPVVSVDVGDVRERILGIKGCYIATPDPSDLAAKLRLVVSSGKRISSHNIQELTLETVAAKLKRFYSDLLPNERHAYRTKLSQSSSYHRSRAPISGADPL
jgi:glycosyltransferase involved in cell wall biosynthesis